LVVASPSMGGTAARLSATASKSGWRFAYGNMGSTLIRKLVGGPGGSDVAEP